MTVSACNRVCQLLTRENTTHTHQKQQQQKMPGNPSLRFLYVACAFLECVLFGGLVFGWGSLVYMFTEEGVYSDLCDGYSPPPVTTTTTTTQRSDLRTNYSADADSASAEERGGEGGVGGVGGYAQQNRSCQARDDRFALVFTVASVALCVGTAAMGQLNFKYGTRLTRLCALVCFTFGGILTAFTSHDLPWLVFPGVSLLGIGGMPLFITNTQFSMLFDRGSSTVVSLLCGAYDTSSGVTLILKLLYERGISLRWSMLAMTALHLLTMVNTFFFLPEGFISKVAPESLTLHVDAIYSNSEEHVMERKCFSAEENGEASNNAERTKKKPLPSLRSCIMSPLYALHVLWLAILQLRFYYLIGSLHSWLSNLFDDKDDVSFYTNVCQYAMMFGLVTSFLAGIVYDINKKMFEESQSQLRRDLMPAVIPLSLTTVLAIALSALVLTNDPSVLYPVFIINVVFRSFMYSLAASYTGVMFPSEYFGVLFGLNIVVSGAVGMGQYGLFAWSQSSGYTSVNIFLIAFLSVSLAHPLYQWITCRRVEGLTRSLQI